MLFTSVYLLKSKAQVDLDWRHKFYIDLRVNTQ